MNRKTVIVIGAGGTLSDAITLKLQKKPPLDKGFFEKVRDANTDRISFELVRAYCKNKYNFNITSQNEDSLESVISILYTDSFRPGKDGEGLSIILCKPQILS